MIKIEQDKTELAIHIINLKIANEINNNKSKTYKELQDKLRVLKQYKKEIYQNNQEVIDNIINEHLQEIKK